MVITDDEFRLANEAGNSGNVKFWLPTAPAIRHLYFTIMPAEARITKLWTQQKGIIPFLFLAYAAWFLWDGFIGYPRSNERWDKHEELKADNAAWEKYCAERGWKTEPPHRRLESKDILGQFVVGGITGAIGLFALIYWQRQRRTVVRSDEEGVTTPSGKRVPYTAITHVDKRRWKAKGLSTVRYTLNGENGQFILDDAKHDPKALDIILGDIVSRGTAKVEE